MFFFFSTILFPTLPCGVLIEDQTLADAALGALPFTPSASFLLILFFVVDFSLFCFVDLFDSLISEDSVNMWGYPVLD